MKKGLILPITVIGLAIIAWWLVRESSLEDKTILPRLSFDKSADRIYIDTDVAFESRAVELTKDENSWKVKEGDDFYPTDETAARDVTETLSKLELQDIVSKNKDRYTEFGFEEAGAVTVSWFQGEDKKGEIYIGRQDYARGGDYLRIGEEGAVYLTKNHIRSVFARGSFKDTRLVVISDTGVVSKIAWEYPEDASSTTLVKKKSGERAWVFEGDENKAVNPDALQAAVDYFATLKAEDIIKYDANFDYGFNVPALTLRITANGKENAIIIGKQLSEASHYYARIYGKEEWVYKLSSQAVNDQLMKRREDFEKKDET